MVSAHALATLCLSIIFVPYSCKGDLGAVCPPPQPAIAIIKGVLDALQFLEWYIGELQSRRYWYGFKEDLDRRELQFSKTHRTVILELKQGKMELMNMEPKWWLSMLHILMMRFNSLLLEGSKLKPHCDALWHREWLGCSMKRWHLLQEYSAIVQRLLTKVSSEVMSPLVEKYGHNVDGGILAELTQWTLKNSSSLQQLFEVESRIYQENGDKLSGTQFMTQFDEERHTIRDMIEGLEKAHEHDHQRYTVASPERDTQSWISSNVIVPNHSPQIEGNNPPRSSYVDTDGSYVEAARSYVETDGSCIDDQPDRNLIYHKIAEVIPNDDLSVLIEKKRKELAQLIQNIFQGIEMMKDFNDVLKQLKDCFDQNSGFVASFDRRIQKQIVSSSLLVGQQGSPPPRQTRKNDFLTSPITCTSDTLKGNHLRQPTAMANRTCSPSLKQRQDSAVSDRVDGRTPLQRSPLISNQASAVSDRMDGRTPLQRSVLISNQASAVSDRMDGRTPLQRSPLISNQASAVSDWMDGRTSLQRSPSISNQARLTYATQPFDVEAVVQSEQDQISQSDSTKTDADSGLRPDHHQDAVLLDRKGVHEDADQAEGSGGMKALKEEPSLLYSVQGHGGVPSVTRSNPKKATCKLTRTDPYYGKVKSHYKRAKKRKSKYRCRSKNDQSELFKDERAHKGKPITRNFDKQVHLKKTSLTDQNHTNRIVACCFIACAVGIVSSFLVRAMACKVIRRVRAEHE